MPATTRSKSRQLRIEDLTDEKQKDPPLRHTGGRRTASSASPIKSENRKRARSKNDDEETASADKRMKTTTTYAQSKKKASTSTSARKRRRSDLSHPSDGNTTHLEKPKVININRAPVLQLWGAVVASFLHPELSWTTCLSIGNAISSLCAVSKGKSIGVIKPKDEDPEARRKRKEAEREKGKWDSEVQVMGFRLPVGGEVAMLGGKGKPLNEERLKEKFGGERQYEQARKVMVEELEGWKEDEEELNRAAFHMYERFRPVVPGGQRGWGRKGELDLETVQNTIRK